MTAALRPLLEVRNLRVEFNTRRGTLVAIDDVSFDIAPGEVLGVVGESGAGKSITGTAIIGLLEPPGRVSGGEILLDGKRIDTLPVEAMRKIRGRQIGAIFQDPLTSLNPLYTVGRQIVETIQTHLPMSAQKARELGLRPLARLVGWSLTALDPLEELLLGPNDGALPDDTQVVFERDKETQRIITAFLVPGFSVAGFWSALFGSVIVSITGIFASWYIGPSGTVDVLVLEGSRPHRM